jgi:hypothetical protein
MGSFTFKIEADFSEQVVKATGHSGEGFILGVKAHRLSEQEKLREEYYALGNSMHILRRLELIQELVKDTTMDEAEQEGKKKELEEEIKGLVGEAKAAQLAFLLPHILFIKNLKGVSYTVDGVEKSVDIKDSRTFTFAGSPWKSNEDLCSVLVEELLDVPFYGEPLLLAMQKGILGIDYKGEEVKNLKR